MSSRQNEREITQTAEVTVHVSLICESETCRNVVATYQKLGEVQEVKRGVT